MKLHQLFESRVTKFSDEIFSSLQNINPNNIENSYKIKNVAFDNKLGLGATPMGQNVIYEGFVAEILPTDFLKLAKPGDRKEDAEKLEKLIVDHCPIAAPFLEFKINKEFDDGEPLEIKISGHEGRARTEAFIKVNGNIPMPVQFFPRGGYRARDLSSDFFRQFRKLSLISESGDLVKPSLGKLFHSGSTL